MDFYWLVIDHMEIKSFDKMKQEFLKAVFVLVLLHGCTTNGEQ